MAEEAALQLINSSDVGSVKAASSAAIQYLLGNEAATDGALDTHVVDAVLAVYVPAIRKTLSANELNDQLASLLEARRADALIEAYTGSADQLLSLTQDRSIPGVQRLSGVVWSSGHCLGDRTIDPPSRSLPYIKLGIKAEGADGTQRTIPLVCSSEQAQDLLAKLKEALHEAEVMSGASAPKKRR